ncbi:replication initiator [Nonomuraea polychroma]
MLGFRGHFSTKSRAYSTTLTALRRARLAYREAQERRRMPYDLLID